MQYAPRRWSVAKLGLQYCEMPKTASNSIHHAINLANNSNVTVPITFVFTFVRHPLTRLVSAYKEKIQTGKYNHILQPQVAADLSRDMSIEDFVDFLLDFDADRHKQEINNHFCPQSWIVRSIPDLDFVGCLENPEDWKELTRRGLRPLEHFNRNTRDTRTWQDMLDKKTEAKARKFFKDDFQMWPTWWGGKLPLRVKMWRGIKERMNSWLRRD